MMRDWCKPGFEWLRLVVLSAVALFALYPANATVRECLLQPARIILVPTHARNYGIAHGAISADLFTGEIVAIRRFKQNDNKHALYLVTLRGTDPYTGAQRYREAFFKPRVWGDEDGWSRSPMEYVAYHLNQKLGMDYVPPTAYRRGLNVQVDGQTFTEGAFILKAPDFKPMADLPAESFPGSHEAVISDHRVLNVLLQNQDGHYWNLGLGRHWVDGESRPVFIDWGASLRPGTNVSMTQYPAYGNSRPVASIRRRTFEAMKALSGEDLLPLMQGGLISMEELRGILARRDGLVSYFQRLVDQAVREGRSADSVLLPD